VSRASVSFFIRPAMNGWMTRVALVTVCTVLGCISGFEKEKRTDMGKQAWRKDDSSWVRGANYVPTYAQNDVQIWNNFNPEIIDRELGYAEQVGINSVRVFFQIIVYEKDPKLFLDRFEQFLQLCDKHHMRMMPVLFDSCFGEEPTLNALGWVANPGNTRVARETWPECEKYIDDVVGKHVGDKRILLWDVMNEPMVAGVYAQKEENREKIWRFVRHFCKYVGTLDPSHPTTVGTCSVMCLPFIAESEDVLSIHSYSGDEEKHRADIRKAKELGHELGGKPLIVSETGHYALNQSYQLALNVCREENVGWYIWELMIGIDPFPSVQGIFYPDGTIRSGDDLSAVLGLRKKEPVNGVFLTRNMSEEQTKSVLKEALATPTKEWNFERRLGDLHAGSLVERIVLLRIQREKPGFSVEEMQKKAVDGDRSDLERYHALRQTVIGELGRGLEEAKQLYRKGDGDNAYRKVDEIVRNIAGQLQIGE